MKSSILLILSVSLPVWLSSCGMGSSYKSDGEAIFMTGKTRDGETVGNNVDRDALQDQDIVLACADCHGADAGGGKNTIASFGPYVAPPIRWSALTNPEHVVPYTDASFTTAVRSGIAPEGYRLHHPMPTWELQDMQIGEIVAFLKTK